jgi:hypothetical protein
MDQSRKQSTRLWLLVIGIVFAVAREVLDHFGVPVSMETLVTIEAMLISVAGLDTVRPLGAGKTPKAPVEENPAKEEPAPKE